MRHLVNIDEAKAHLSRLIEQARSGEEVVIAKAGRPVAQLVPCQLRTIERMPGQWRGRVELADDFDILPAAPEAAFRGDAD